MDPSRASGARRDRNRALITAWPRAHGALPKSACTRCFVTARLLPAFGTIPSGKRYLREDRARQSRRSLGCRCGSPSTSAFMALHRDLKGRVRSVPPQPPRRPKEQLIPLLLCKLMVLRIPPLIKGRLIIVAKG